MKVCVESKSFTDKKKNQVVNYDEFSTELVFDGFDPHKLVLKIEDRMAKVLLADNIETADFALKITKTKENNDYYTGVVHFLVGAKSYEVKVSLSKDQILLLRLYLRQQN